MTLDGTTALATRAGSGHGAAPEPVDTPGPPPLRRHVRDDLSELDQHHGCGHPTGWHRAGGSTSTVSGRRLVASHACKWND